MKKIYMMPSLKVKEIKVNTILAGSDPIVGVNGDATAGADGYSGPQAKESFGFDDDVEDTYGKVNNTVW